jgi:outer membrane PBP1 activator LpoA protein
VALLLAGCTAQAPREPTETLEPIQVGPVERLTVAPGAYTALLESVGQLLEEDQATQASRLLEFAAAGELTVDEQALFAVLASRLTLRQDSALAALKQFEALAPPLSSLVPERRWQAGLWHALLLRRSGDNLGAANAGDALLTLAMEPAERQRLVNRVWVDLQHATRSQVERALASAEAPHWRGWLALNLAADQALRSPGAQTQALADWRSAHGDHPAAAVLPGGLEELATLAPRAPQRVALLLPLSNSLAVAGQAVMEGYLATLMLANAEGWPEQRLSVFDTVDYPDINAAYDAAVAAGNELVIGPLTRGELAGWQPARPPAVPLLSLNRFPQPVLDDRVIFQLSLTPAEEAVQLAEFAADEGGRRALLIRPSGEWGDNMSEHLSRRWEALGGEVVSRAVYQDRSEYSDTLQAALALEESEQRAAGLRRLLASNLEFSPRRRADIDTVFLLTSRSSEARAIKPLIAYHYAEDLPVYSTSHVYNASLGLQQNRDLEALRLLELPWIMAPADPVVASVASGAPVDSLAAMYALGADAFLLHWRLPQLRQQGSSLRGHTGLLTLDERGQLQRKLARARISDGQPEVLNN